MGLKQQTGKGSVVRANEKSTLTRSQMKYAERRKNGQCARCGKRKPAHAGMAYCEDCSKYYSETRLFYLSMGFCPLCHRNRVFGSEKSCPECRARRKAINRRSFERATEAGKEWAKPEHKSADQKRRYAKRKEQGICTRCGKRPAEDGRARCRACLDKDAGTQREYRMRKKDAEEQG